METVQQNGRFTLFSSKFLSIYSILYAWNPLELLESPLPLEFSKTPIKSWNPLELFESPKHMEFSETPINSWNLLEPNETIWNGTLLKSLKPHGTQWSPLEPHITS